MYFHVFPDNLQVESKFDLNFSLSTFTLMPLKKDCAIKSSRCIHNSCLKNKLQLRQEYQLHTNQDMTGNLNQPWFLAQQKGKWLNKKKKRKKVAVLLKKGM